MKGGANLPSKEYVMIKLKPKIVYTPTRIYQLCEGITFQRQLPLSDPNYGFRYYTSEKQYNPMCDGQESVNKLKVWFEANGYEVPEGFGDYVPFKLRNVRISGKNITTTFKPIAGLPPTKLSFQYGNSYGAFHRAVSQAVKARNYFKALTDHMKKMITLLPEGSLDKKFSSGTLDSLVGNEE